ncbi:protein takeout-like, partial [Condylostylus longicornis]|uniref:protein takeout-like n=1 Tax=Condylostylus longicornis TaxID=2530218 RepID=UPI00244DF078
MSKKFSITLFALLSIIVSGLAEFPSDVKRCQAEDVACISNTITDLLRNNPNGKEDIGLPNINPYKIKKIIISDSNNANALNLDLMFLDVELRGLPEAIIEKSVGFSSDPSKSKFEIYGVIPKLELKSKYKANGRILILPIQGEGDQNIVATNVKASIKFKPTILNRDGKILFTENKVKVLLEPQGLHMRLENLFNGNKELGENMNTFLNENWKDVWTELAPSIHAAIGDVLTSILSNVFNKISYDE